LSLADFVAVIFVIERVVLSGSQNAHQLRAAGLSHRPFYSERKSKPAGTFRALHGSAGEASVVFTIAIGEFPLMSVSFLVVLLLLLADHWVLPFRQL
jgi:hypothetical protein